MTNHTTTPPVPVARGDENDLFRRHHTQLQRSVRRAVNASGALIEDACSFAWAQLLRYQPERETVFAWLRTVAIREAYRLSRLERRDGRLEALAADQDCDGEGWQDLIGASQLETELEARRALDALAQLPERQRRYSTLLAAGYSYREICQLTGATYTNVNKHLTRARARIRESERGA